MKTIAIAFKIYHSSAIFTILSECETFSNQFHSFNALSHNTNSVCLCKALNLRVKCVFLSNKVFWTQFTRFFLSSCSQISLLVAVTMWFTLSTLFSRRLTGCYYLLSTYFQLNYRTLFQLSIGKSVDFYYVFDSVREFHKRKQTENRANN